MAVYVNYKLWQWFFYNCIVIVFYYFRLQNKQAPATDTSSSVTSSPRPFIRSRHQPSSRSRHASRRRSSRIRHSTPNPLLTHRRAAASPRQSVHPSMSQNLGMHLPASQKVFVPIDIRSSTRAIVRKLDTINKTRDRNCANNVCAWVGDEH